MTNSKREIQAFILVAASLMLTVRPARSQFPAWSPGQLQMPPVEMPASLFEISCHII